MKDAIAAALLIAFFGLMALAGPGGWIALYVIGQAVAGRLPN